MDDLENRVQQFNMLSLPGQPMFMHVGTSALVNDLWREVQQLNEFDKFHPRAMKLLRKRKEFVVISVGESYFAEVFALIRQHEKIKGTWNDSDETNYQNIVEAISPICGIEHDYIEIDEKIIEITAQATDQSDDSLMTKAMDFGKKNGYVSLSTLQRHLRIGFTTAARLIDRMVADGFCSAEYSENGQRKVLASSSRYQDDAR